MILLTQWEKQVKEKENTASPCLKQRKIIQTQLYKKEKLDWRNSKENQASFITKPNTIKNNRKEKLNKIKIKLITSHLLKTDQIIHPNMTSWMLW